jgi:hypothetical protein
MLVGVRRVYGTIVRKEKARKAFFQHSRICLGVSFSFDLNKTKFG